MTMARSETKPMHSDIKSELEQIGERNKRVEADKAWETSKTRRFVIVVFIYVLAFWVFYSINAPQPEINALIPAAGFALSTMSVPFLKKWWLKKMYKQ